MKPICVKCQRFYRPYKNGRWFVEGMPKNNDAVPGKDSPNEWKPYKVWVGDEWICYGCGHLVIVGVGRQPVQEQHHPGFGLAVAKADYLQVNDC